jgi:hypothetical protein
MKRMRIIGLAIVALFAMAAVTAASASATPTFYECAKAPVVAKKATGKYNNATCTEENVKSEGKYELKAGVGKGKAFKGTGKAATLHTPAVGGEVKCTGSKDEGFNTLTGQSKVKVTFTGCTSLGKKCTSISPAGKKAGEIVTNPLEGKLGYISSTPVKVGVSLSGEAGKPSAEFGCEGLEIVTTGAVIGEITKDINAISKEATDSFTVNGSGFQTITSFEGGPEEVLSSTINGGGPFVSGEETSTLNKGEALEIKA